MEWGAVMVRARLDGDVDCPARRSQTEPGNEMRAGLRIARIVAARDLATQAE